MGADNTMWPESHARKLLALRAAGSTYAEIGEEFGKSAVAVRSKLRKLQRSQSKALAAIRVPPGATETLSPSSELFLEVDDFLVASDFHVPGESAEWVDRLVEYGAEHLIKHLVINGDFWNHDAVSRWQFKDPSMGLKTEIKRGISLVKRLQAHFKLYFVCGNHDSRLPKALDYALNFTDWMDALFGGTVTTTDFDYIKVSSAGREFRICHPQYYSRTKGKEASELAHNLQENIIMAHQHFLGTASNRTGKYLCIDCGCMCSQDMFYYKKSTTSKCPTWENGFVHVKDGKVKLICDYTF